MPNHIVISFDFGGITLAILTTTKNRLILTALFCGLATQCGDDPVNYEVVGAEGDSGYSSNKNSSNAEINKEGNSENSRKSTKNRQTVRPTKEIEKEKEKEENKEKKNEEEKKSKQHTTDVYQQSENDAIDLLWVIDNSGSMKPFQNALRASFDKFIKTLNSDDIDFQIGITSTDSCPDRAPQNLEENLCPDEFPESHRVHHRGDLVGKSGKRVIKSGDRDVVDRFRRLAAVGTGGSSFEHGLTSAVNAIDKSLDGLNGSFLRPDAYLAMIVLSDENDDGVGLSEKNETGINFWKKGKTRYHFDASDFNKAVKSKLGTQRFSLSSIVADADSRGMPCKLANGRALEVGKEYQKASKLTGGHIESLCDNNWTGLLERLAANIKKQLLEFSLSKRPIISSIKVFVDGSEVEGWSYKNASNKIRFSKKNAPAAGSNIEINYRLAP